MLSCLPNDDYSLLFTVIFHLSHFSFEQEIVSCDLYYFSSGGVRRALTSGLANRLTPTLPRLATLAPAWVLHLNWVPWFYVAQAK